MSLQCFYKLGVIAYYNLNRDYIAEVLCVNKERQMGVCHGQCFLKRNLDLTEKSASDNREVPATKQQMEFPLFLISELTYKFNVVSKLTDEAFQYTTTTFVGHLSVPFRPPAFFS